ncbi:MAG TPA: hypothetical protein VM470_07660 [Acidimicrobiia bacterium]|nr:hypothetical protein [Acidimicrobiia bacterium]
MNTPLIRQRLAPRARTFGFALVLWLFGLFTSVLLVGLWGRTVAGDSSTLEVSARAVLESEFVNERIENWLIDGITTAGHTSIEAGAVVDAVLASDEVQASLDSLIDEAVVVALTPPGAPVAANVSSSVDHFVDAVASELAERGIAVDPEPVRQAAMGLTASMLSDHDRRLVTTTALQARALLTTVVAVCLAGILLTGALAVRFSEDGIRQMRALAVRLAVSAFTFAVFLRVGAWAVDPSGGRSPLATGGAVLLGSNGHVPLFVAVAGALAGGAATIAIRRRRRLHQLVLPDKDPTEEIPILV